MSGLAKQLKWSSGLVILTVVALLFLVPYSLFVHRAEPEVTEIFFADRITEAHRVLIERYNTLHAGSIRVIPIDFPNPDFSTNERKEILARSLRGEGDGIDLLAVDVVWVQRFEKWCEPLNGYFSERELQAILPELLASCYSDGKLVAIPLDMVLAVMYYREDLLKSAEGGEQVIRTLDRSLTWPEFLEVKQRLHWGKPFYVFPAADYEGLICSYVEILLGLNKSYFTAVGFNFETAEAKKALQLLVDLVHKYKATPPVVTSFTEVPSYQYFLSNDGLFIRGWTSYDEDFKNSPYDMQKRLQLRKAPLPHLPGGKPASTFGGWHLMVSKFSSKKSAVVDFVKFLLREESQEVFYTQGGYYPVISSFYQDSTSLRKYPEIADIKRLMRTGVHRPPQKEYTHFSEIMSHYFTLAIQNRISVDEALSGATRAIRSEQTLVATR